jgi:hypothetical protein
VRGDLHELGPSAFGVNRYLVGDVMDQAQLHGLLERVRYFDFGLNPIKPLPTETGTAGGANLPVEADEVRDG